ncbi:MAG: tRNA (guanosine(37)-N1)-methyltransferase TrmD [Alphaproteobacteria bacterium]|nr:tRNA (guanosine(37)-N1)-methyltransferase TrmD [Alphaproteobacteria bacterium]
MIRFHIISMFPESVSPYLATSILKRAQQKKACAYHFYDPVAIASRKTFRIDKRPYGGGPGMVLEAEPFLKAHARAVSKAHTYSKGARIKIKTVFFSPSAPQWNQKKAKTFSRYTDIIFFCGHYEGIDERVARITKAEHVAVGHSILTGGEIPALVCIDSMVRELKGVLGNDKSIENKRVSSPEVYTRPPILTWKGKKYKVPSVLLSGDHKKIDTYKTIVHKKRTDIA